MVYEWRILPPSDIASHSYTMRISHEPVCFTKEMLGHSGGGGTCILIFVKRSCFDCVTGWKSFGPEIFI